MTKEEANKIIARFMGYDKKLKQVFLDVGCNHFSHHTFTDGSGFKCVTPRYTKSLDALISVWEKLAKLDGSIMSYNLTNYWHDCYDTSKKWQFYFYDCEITTGEGPTPQEAAAIATAKVIQELSK